MTSDPCPELAAPTVPLGGKIANVGVHEVKAVLHLEALSYRNVTITTRLVDTVRPPMLLKNVRLGRIEPRKLITHRFRLGDILTPPTPSVTLYRHTR